MDDVIWREDIDSLAFRPSGHAGYCVVHRLAFRTLLRGVALPETCRAFFADHRETFEAAARQKSALKGLAMDASFHLTSRDLRRSLAGTAPVEG